VSNNGHLQAKESKNSVATQSQKLEASEQERPMLQPQPEVEGLEGHYWGASVSLNWKVEEAGVMSSGRFTAVIDMLLSGRMQFRVLADSLLLHFWSFQASSPLDGAAHIQDRCSTSVTIPYANPFWKHLDRYSYKCALLTS
jgi:hypothetical protein